MPTYVNSTERELGFSLLEMAIVLIIMGIVGGALGQSGLFWKNQEELFKTRVTTHHQERVFQALGAFLRVHRFLPLPTDPVFKHNISLGSWAMGSLAHRGDGPIQGIVPFHTLGLSKQYAKDGYGRFFTYVVAKELTNCDFQTKPISQGQSFLEHFCQTSSMINHPFQGITLRAKGLPLEMQKPHMLGPASTPDVFSIAVVLISHGPSGEGSLRPEGGRVPFRRGGRCKRINGDGTQNFCLEPEAGDSGLFDDVIRYETRLNLASTYAGIHCRSCCELNPALRSDLSNGSP